MASIVVCGNPDPFAQTESRDCVSARPESSANAPVPRKSATISATRQTLLVEEIRASDGVEIVHRPERGAQRL
ncbi:MAG TPA: hypothetical protein VHX14_16365 [Thermoanaerobaculia bacterium]|jgi:hypothetical protein|nr:hypothetical protein [Thermoanaerobaculia bacterium]